MSRFVVDSVSARTLPALDKLYVTDKNKLDAILERTPREPLVRLFKASLARNIVPGFVDPELGDAAALVEILIHNNLLSRDGDNNEKEFDATVEQLTDNILRYLLVISLARFKLLQGGHEG